MRKCYNCDGTGKFDDNECPVCGGSGEIESYSRYGGDGVNED